jgi:hypothetical protein
VGALQSHGSLGGPPRLVATGLFVDSGGSTVNGIATWDGASWSALGGGSIGLVSDVSAAGGALYAGGDFTQIGGVAARSVARWDGIAWSPVGNGVDYPVLDLANFDDGSGDALFVTGPRSSSFPGEVTYAVERWNGSAWNDTVRNRGLDGPVLALTAFDNGTDPALIAVGEFVHAGDVTVNGLAQWNGIEWTTLGTPIDGVPRVPFSFDDGSGEALYVGGTGIGFGGSPGSNIARWDGASWSALGSGTNGFVRTMTAFDDGTGVALFVGGAFSAAGAVSAQRIAKWDGSTWSALGGGLDNSAFAMTTFDDGTGSALYVGGAFTTAGGAVANRIARWDGTTWSAVGSGFNGSVYALAVFDDGSGPALYAGGQFNVSGGSNPRGIARWNGSTWSELDPNFVGTVRSLCTFDDGSGNGDALYVCGIIQAPVLFAQNIARWNGASWSALGTGLSASSPLITARAEALAVFDDGSGNGGDLYVGGEFDLAAPAAAKNIARWNGCGEIGLLFCFGDDSSGACPCSNASTIGMREGCRNSTALGATLRATGTASLTNDSLVLRGAQMPDAPAIYFQGTLSAAGGNGLAAGDGLLCVGGALTRMGVVMNTNGSSSFPAVGATSLSLAGGVGAPGTRTYQVHYRDTANYCTPHTFNFTNALRIVWTP